MSGDIVSKQKGAPLATGTGNATPNSEVPAALKILTINVFFDGTGNNKYNTQARLEEKHTHLDGQASYDNEYTNVALLNKAAADRDDMANVYIEGAGTFTHGEDTLYGLGFGKGESSVYERVGTAFEEVEKANRTKAKKIQLNVFGFSRGAFYARVFCAIVKFDETDKLAKKYGREKLTLSPAAIQINLVGIFDTVSSYGYGHLNDPKDFPLDIGKKQNIHKIVHFTAQNEYRSHFPLTRVNTAGEGGNAFECSFPGAHSNLGGGYTDEWDREKEQYISLYRKHSGTDYSRRSGEIHWTWYKQMGYYQGEPTEEKGSYGDFTVAQHSVGNRSTTFSNPERLSVVMGTRVVRNHYQYIILGLMKKIAEDIAKISFTGEESNAMKKRLALVANSSDKVLHKFQKHAQRYVFDYYKNNGIGYTVSADAALTPRERQHLYRNYIHSSMVPSRGLEGVPGESNDSNQDQSGNPRRITVDINKYR